MPPLPGFGNAVILRNSLFSLSGVRLYGGHYNLRQKGQNVFQHFNIAAIIKIEDLMEPILTKHEPEQAENRISERFLGLLYCCGSSIALCLLERGICLLCLDKM